MTRTALPSRRPRRVPLRLALVAILASAIVATPAVQAAKPSPTPLTVFSGALPVAQEGTPPAGCECGLGPFIGYTPSATFTVPKGYSYLELTFTTRIDGSADLPAAWAFHGQKHSQDCGCSPFLPPATSVSGPGGFVLGAMTPAAAFNEQAGGAGADGTLIHADTESLAAKAGTYSVVMLAWGHGAEVHVSVVAK